MRVVLLNALVVSIAVGLGLPTPGSAHHSVSSEFDLTKRVTLTGVITQVEWVNPHAWFYIDVKDPKTSKVSNWAFQLNSPNALAKLGWTRDMLKVGDIVTVEGALSKDGWAKGNTRRITLPDGRIVLALFSPAN